MHLITPRICIILSLCLLLSACDDGTTTQSADTSGDTSGSTSGTSGDTSGSTSGTSGDTSGSTSGTSGDTSGSTSGTSGDTSGSTSGTPDAEDTTPDAEDTTPDAEDTTPDAEDTTPDAEDTTPPDAEDTTPVACEYIDLQWYIVECQDSGLTYIKEFVDVEGKTSDCPSYFQLYDFPYPTLAEAMADGPCSDTCVYTASNSVSAIRCEPSQRYGYIIYRAEGCDDLYEFAEGLFPSLEAWEAENPCPAP